MDVHLSAARFFDPHVPGGWTRIDLSLVRQPVDYKPSPLELMPPERVVPPGG